MTIDSAAPDASSFSSLLAWGTAALRATDEPRLEAEILLAHVAQTGRATLLAYPERRLVDSDSFRAQVQRRAAGEPLAYIIGSREFYSLEIAVTPAVLIPRSETELLVDAVLARATESETVLELGTGSGAIASALGVHSELAITAIDCDPCALAVAGRNLSLHAPHVELLESDWYAALGSSRYDLIVANPPYVRSWDRHFDGPLRYEPRKALDGGPNGLTAFHQILRNAGHHLTAGGTLLLEHGFDQRPALRALAVQLGFAIVAEIDDLARQPRVLVLTPA